MAVQLTTDWNDLSEEEVIRLKEELRIMRELRNRPSEGRLPYLPHYSGDDGVKLEHYLSAIRSLRGYSDETNTHAIRKTVKGTAATVIGNVDYTATKDDLVDLLKSYFEDVSEKTSAWQKFYSATQHKSESLVEWRTRLHQLHKNTRSATMDDTIMKDKLYLGLHNQRLLDLTVWKYEDPKATEADLFKLLRKNTERIQTKSAAVRNVELENKVQELKAQVATLSKPTNKPVSDVKTKKGNQAQQWKTVTRSNKQKKRSAHNSRSAQWKWQSSSRDRYRWTTSRWRSDSRHQSQDYYTDRHQRRRSYSRSRSTSRRRTDHHWRRSTRSRSSSYIRRTSSTSRRRRSITISRSPSYDKRYKRDSLRRRSISSTRDRDAHKHEERDINTDQHPSPIDTNTNKTTPAKKRKKKKKKLAASLQTRLVGKTNTEVIRINGVDCSALLDSGSVISSVSESFHKEYLADKLDLRPISEAFPFGLRITSATEHQLNILGFVEVLIMFPGLYQPIPVLVTVLRSSILTDQMPALIGSNGLEEWKSNLEKTHSSVPSINSVIDTWKCETPHAGVMTSTTTTTVQPKNCEVISAKVTIKDVKPYERTLLFTPHQKYASIAATTINVPRNATYVNCELATIPTRATSKQTKVLTGATIGSVCPIKEEVYISTEVDEPSQADGDDKQKFLDLFERESWPSDITNDIEGLLWHYRDVFALSHHQLGCFNRTKHEIELTDETPIKQKYRRIPPHLFQAVKEELHKLLDNGVIQPSTSPFSSPISIAIKKDGTPRICLDFRKINAVTKKDAKCIPSVDELIDSLHGKKVFSSIDLMQGYHQQELTERSKKFTAFNAGPIGFFEYARLPFGLSNSSASFQRMMEYILRDLLPHLCLVYIDDVIIHSYNNEEHLDSLAKVFRSLRKYNIKLKPSKCTFFKTKLNFLGHTISDEGICADVDKVKAIQDWKAPTSVKQVRQFQGLAGFLRRYIANFASIAQPITDLLKGYSNKKGEKAKNRKLEAIQFKWGKEQETAFRQLKKKIAEDVVLAYPDFDKPFRLSTDASRNGLGATLEQEQEDGKYRPVAFASRRTSAAEKQYPVHKLEFLALKWSVCEKFKDYLRSKPFVCYTDNNPLTYVFKTAKLDATAQRWVSQLEPYDMRVVYRPGTNNVVADALSRKYDDEEFDNTQHIQHWARTLCEGFDSDRSQHLAATTVKDTTDTTPTTNFDWNVLQTTDITTTTVKKCIEDDTVVSDAERTPAVKGLLKVKDKLVVFKNLLYYQEDPTATRRLVVPNQQKKELTLLYHTFGHFGVTRNYKQLKQRFYWNNMKQTVTEVCSTCDRCQRAKTPKEKNKGPLTHIITPARPMHQLSIDFLAIDTKAQTKCKILTCVDEFTKYAFGILVKSENAEKTAEALYRNIYTKFGIPETVHSDNGATFVGKVLAGLNKLLGIRHTVTTTYRPQSNGSCERLNSTLISRIRTLHPREKRRWYFHIDSLVMAYNTTIHESTNTSPFQAMYGRQAKIPIDLLVHLPDQDEQQQRPRTVKSFAKEREKELKRSYEIMKDNIDRRRARSKRNHDDKLAQPVTFKKGDKVLVRKFTQKNKVDDRFHAEIHTVLNQKDDVPLFLIQGLESGTIKTIHRDHLILFHQSPDQQTDTTTDLEDITTWDNYQNKEYPVDEDETWPVVKKINARVGLHFGKSTELKADYTMTVTDTTTEDEICSNLKSAKTNQLTSAVISSKSTKKETIEKMIKGVRQEISHKSWTKIILSTNSNLTYNLYIEVLCTYFPKKALPQPPKAPHSESDDDSEVEYYIPQQQDQPQPPDVQDEDPSSGSEAEEDSEEDLEEELESDEDEEEQPGHRYNLRGAAGRRPPAHLQDYVTYTIVPR